MATLPSAQDLSVLTAHTSVDREDIVRYLRLPEEHRLYVAGLVELLLQQHSLGRLRAWLNPFTGAQKIFRIMDQEVFGRGYDCAPSMEAAWRVLAQWYQFRKKIEHLGGVSALCGILVYDNGALWVEMNLASATPIEGGRFAWRAGSILLAEVYRRIIFRIVGLEKKDDPFILTENITQELTAQQAFSYRKQDGLLSPCSSGDLAGLIPGATSASTTMNHVVLSFSGGTHPVVEPMHLSRLLNYVADMQFERPPLQPPQRLRFEVKLNPLKIFYTVGKE